jgi:hypothetical protein
MGTTDTFTLFADEFFCIFFVSLIDFFGELQSDICILSETPALVLQIFTSISVPQLELLSERIRHLQVRKEKELEACPRFGRLSLRLELSRIWSNSVDLWADRSLRWPP